MVSFRKIWGIRWKILLWLGIIMFLIISRFGYLDWGSPWYFHPDERNVASAVVRIYDQVEGNTPDPFNPHFFAYGGLPIYIIYGLTFLVTQLKDQTDPFIVAIVIGRVISALWMTLIPLLTWKIAKYWGGKVARYSFLLSVFSVGYIQFARFGTFESWLTFSYLLLLYILIKLNYKWSIGLWIGACLIVGVTIAIKIPSLYLLPLLGIVWIQKLVNLIIESRSIKVKFILMGNMFLTAIIGLIIIFCTFALSNPYAFDQKLVNNLEPNLYSFLVKSMTSSVKFVVHNNFWETENLQTLLGDEFLHSINVERAIAMGKIDVFYTRHFKDTTGGLYQMEMIMPWVSSVPMVAMSLLGFGILVWLMIKKQTPSVLLMLWVALQLGFIFPLYVKWTRYMIPVIPGFIIAASIAIDKIFLLIDKLWTNGKVKIILSWGVMFGMGWHLIYTFMFGVMLTQEDTRTEAANWMQKSMSKDVRILSEIYDLGILPFNRVVPSSNITLYNFYDMDNGSLDIGVDPKEIVADQDVIVILSRRIWKNSTDNKQYYPHAADFYTKLFNGDLGFIKVQEFSNYPRFGPLIINDELKAEETFSVFDHPRIQIWVNHDKYDKIML